MVLLPRAGCCIASSAADNAGGRPRAGGSRMIEARIRDAWLANERPGSCSSANMRVVVAGVHPENINLDILRLSELDAIITPQIIKAR